jgi:hypothetical protein
MGWREAVARKSIGWRNAMNGTNDLTAREK